MVKGRHPSKFYVFCCCGLMPSEVLCLWSCSSLHPHTMFLVVGAHLYEFSFHESCCGPISSPDLPIQILTCILVVRFETKFESVAMQTNFLFELRGFCCKKLSSVLGGHGIDKAFPNENALSLITSYSTAGAAGGSYSKIHSRPSICLICHRLLEDSTSIH